MFMIAMQEHDLKRFVLDINSFDFIFDDKRRNIISNIGIEIESYYLILSTLNKRSDLKINVVDQILSERNLINGVAQDPNNLIEIIGQSNNMQLKTLTDAVIDMVDETIPSMLKMKDDLISILKSKYPGVHFMDFDFADI